MEKIILVDGNNLLFRSYYATAYTGNIMKNSKNFPTNALYGFVNMINKIINEEKPTYMMVAFDKGKTFRHDKYDWYKSGRNETPEELKMQFPIAKEMLTNMGIKYYEIDNYEADDIIGTFSMYCNKDSNYVGTIISSDKDLLQLISSDVDIKLLRQKDFIRYNEETFKETYGFEPIKVIDLKALMGDASDKIPGVKGIGEKTAIKLLQKYGSLKGVYDNLDDIGGKVQEKLESDKENAFMSYDIATIVTDVPMEISIDDTKYLGPNYDKLNEMFEELEFKSFLTKKEKKQEILNYEIVDDENFFLSEDSSIYVEILGTNYHTSEVLGVSLFNKNKSYFLKWNIFIKCFKNILPYLKYTYDLKKLYVLCKYNNLSITKEFDDIMVMSSLLDYDVKEDISYLSSYFDYNISRYDEIYGKSKKKEPDKQIVMDQCVKKAKFIYDIQEEILNKLNESNQFDLYKSIELPLIFVLGDMEFDGICVNRDELVNMGDEIKLKIDLISNEIYNYAGEEFNISSPIQLGRILFEKLELKHGKKTQRGYSTSGDILLKLKGSHPIVEKIIEYRMLSKLYSTYVEGLLASSIKDSKIHTIYTQVLTRTGRLSSIEPNLQNIPIRYEYGKLIRKAFVPSSDSVILSSDYSQIELRILAHMANVDALINAFKSDLDIHSTTASAIFHVSLEEVTSNMRRIAKAVNFGIIYGISSFGLSENLDISMKEAKQFIDHYLETYPGIKEYMDKTKSDAYEDNIVETMFHRKRYIKELSNSNYMVRQQGERIALNTPIQGTSADIIKMAMVKIYEEFKTKDLKSKMIVQVHDELVFDVLKSEKDEVIKIVKNVMENICKLTVPLKVDIEYGDDWYQAK